MKAKAKADYKHYIINFKGHNCLTIVDEDLGNRSVTNDISNIIEDIKYTDGIDIDKYTIIYRDSHKIWDGWDNKHGAFISLNEPDYEMALEKMIKKAKA